MKEYEVLLSTNAAEVFTATKVFVRDDGRLEFYKREKVIATIEKGHWIYVRVKPSG